MEEQNKLKLVFDIGYSIGLFSKIILETNPQCQIVGVEANPEVIDRNELKGHPNVVVINAAISDKANSTIPFYMCCGGGEHVLSTANPKWMTGRFVNQQWQPPITIQTITLDELIEFYGIPELIKVDVEGYELSALKGLTKHIPAIISFEWTEEFFTDCVACVDYLKSIGYTKFGYIDCIDDKRPEKEWLPVMTYDNWEKLAIHNNIKPERKWQWGMIYCK